MIQIFLENKDITSFEDVPQDDEKELKTGLNAFFNDYFQSYSEEDRHLLEGVSYFLGQNIGGSAPSYDEHKLSGIAFSIFPPEDNDEGSNTLSSHIRSDISDGVLSNGIDIETQSGNKYHFDLNVSKF